MSTITIYDPTATDQLSKVRGVGRYLQVLKENLPQATFTDNLDNVDKEGIFINPFFDPLKTPLTLNKVAKRQVAVIHDVIPLKYPEAFPVGLRGKANIFLNMIALKKYDLIITDSQHSKKSICELLHVSENKVQVVYPTLAKAFWEHTKTSPETFIQLINKYDLPDRYFIFVSDATWNKNIVNIAKAIKLANVTCVFVGKVYAKYVQQKNRGNGWSETGQPLLPNKAPITELTHPWQKELKEFLQETKDDHRFIFPGFISDDELKTLYQGAVANILVSRDEGFGYSFVEAGSLGTPSVLSQSPIFKETAQDAALFTDDDNSEHIANCLQELLASKKKRNDLGEKAQKRVAVFKPEHFKKELLEVISN